MGCQVGLVVDSSACAKWFFEEEHRAEALRLLQPGRRFRAPDLLPAEIGSIAWKKCTRKEITADQATAALAAFRKVPVDLMPATELARAALSLALTLGHPFYDCLYLALAEREQARVVTADKRLRNKLAGTAYASLIFWIEDVP